MAQATVRLPEIGKISPEAFEHYIRPRLGARRPDVLVPPQNGVDVGVVDLGNGKVMALSTDPVFIVPEYGWERAAWFCDPHSHVGHLHQRTPSRLSFDRPEPTPNDERRGLADRLGDDSPGVREVRRGRCDRPHGPAITAATTRWSAGPR
ncbi:MAG: hypothetical protein KatS3mg115_1911 [Candidatus Poribacteria bacterium]|nr:MAG: hypothetical protein KatS3mg115_1911 [Candidatus Poribacteria bacterium]